MEWNLGIDRASHPAEYEEIVREFEALWSEATVVDARWVAAYARRRPIAPERRVDTVPEPLPPPPDPHEVQVEALLALRNARQRKDPRALVVLATGLGKTWLAAFDLRAFRETRPGARVLFVAHREELLRQAAATLRRVSKADVEETWCVGEQTDLSGEVVLASVQKLSQPASLDLLARERFDYVVVDEVHHATARSYQKILARVSGAFVLGLTATPDRADAQDVYKLFGGGETYRANIRRGVAIGRLVPFAYFGVKDTIDFREVPWRNQRFDLDVLAEKASRSERMESLWKAWTTPEYAGTRTLVFCCTTAHADFARDWLRGRGVRVAAVHSGTTSDDRAGSLDELTKGGLDALCAVDLFNEGIDLPLVDRVVMLRPTESGVVFLQQLGRGLRAAEGKKRLTVIDFVGNHRVSVEHLRWAAAQSMDDPSPKEMEKFLRAVTDTKGDTVDLDGAFSVALELEAKTSIADWIEGERRPRRSEPPQSVVDAGFLVRREEEQLVIVVKARGGTGVLAINPQYAEGLRLIVQRLSGAGFVLDDAIVDSKEVERKGLSIEDRRILDSVPRLLDDPDAVTSELRSRQRVIGQAPGAKGGSDTKRIKLTASHPEEWSVGELADLLEDGLPAAPRR